MTKEERAEKWLSGVPNANKMSMEKKMKICSKVAKKMSILFFAVFLVECILLFLVKDGMIFNHIADFLNSLMGGHHSRNKYMGLAVAGGLVCLPIIALPVIVTLIFKKKWLEAESRK